METAIQYLFEFIVFSAIACAIYFFIKDVFISNKGKMKGKIVFGRFR